MIVEPWLIALDTELLLRSRSVDMVEAAFARRRGPKYSISWLGFLLAVRLAFRRKYFQIQDAAAIYVGLPDEVHQRLGYPARPSRRTPTAGRLPRTMADKVLDDFQHMWQALRQALDDSPITRPHLGPAEREQVYQLRVAFCDALGSGWLPVIPHNAHVEDGTAVDGFRNSRFGGDPHFRRGHRTKTHRDPRESVDGFLLSCMIPAGVGSEVDPPYVVLHHELVPANETEGVVAIRLYRRHASHCQLGWAIDDRYLSYAPYDYSLKILRLGGRPVHYLHENLRGQHGLLLGFLVIDSWLWHPDLTAEYWNLTHHASNQLAGRYRSRFACQLLCGPTNEHPLEVLVGCSGRTYDDPHPAALRCNRSGDTQVDPEAPLVSRCASSDICRSPDGVWISLVAEGGAPSAIGRAFQELPRLSPAWFETYRPLRAHVENTFATLTTPLGANLADRTHWIWGLPGTAIWAGNGVAIHNHHRLYRWLINPQVRAHLDADYLQGLDDDILFADRWLLTEHFHRLFRT